MVRGQYIAATSMMVQRKKMDAITNNMVNADTVGFKKDHLVSRSFDSVLIERINDPAIVRQSNATGPLTFGSYIDQLYTNFEEGNLEPTELQTDLAIVGDGFFVVETPEGERFTRAGNFVVDVEGFLVDPDGRYVLGEGGRIQVGRGSFTVRENGAIFVDGEPADRLRVETFEDLNILRKQGDNLYYPLGGGGAVPSEAFGIRQNCLENSNIDVGREMVDMMTMYREYETNQRMLHTIDETMQKAVELGRLR